MQQRKKRTREDRERERESVLRHLQMLQIGSTPFRSGTHRLMGSQGQQHHYAALGIRISQRSLSLILVRRLEVVALRGQEFMFRSRSPTVAQRQKTCPVVRSHLPTLHRLSYLISGGYQGPE